MTLCPAKHCNALALALVLGNLIGFPALVYADNQCLRLALSKLLVSDSKLGISERQAEQHYRMAIGKMQSTLLNQSSLALPQEPIVLEIKPMFNHGTPAETILYDGEIKIRVPYQWQVEKRIQVRPDVWKKYAKHPNATLPILYHEIGHQIFRTNAESSNSLLGEYFRFRKAQLELNANASRLIEKYKTLPEGPEKTVTVEKLKGYQAQFQEWKTYEGSSTFVRTRQIADALNEYFADVTTVLASENPKAIVAVDSMTTPRPGPLKKYIRDAELTRRDFTNVANRLDSWKTGRTIDAHDYFAPARYFLYDEYLRFPRYISGPEKGRLYDSVFKAILQFAQDTLRTEGPIAPVEMNRRLISAIKTEMSKLTK